ncbi:transcriptional regulator, LysR family protein [Roseobacter sp. SK209-2-6]|uniref:LysR substrate-binding domain-containing protein n=1 Tax=Roseobacter sp. SK209-2-6 TaxID=388739 RepID=UPI0000F3CE8D|nr:LysR substrate-binding domain-containing protein [Roseobacter sp. SK209-2-6]EBA15898.1 transcriptional regulator, LysR family protein [Roseobacter sp. SK209-2-6]
MPVSPPRPRNLSLTALRAFEAAARLGGFAAAGQELGVTPGAISAQIKSLEEELGAPLFLRGVKGVQLSALGQRALPGFSQVFDQLGEAIQILRDEAPPRIVHIATLPAIAQYWLSPRLPRLRSEMPGTEISITALEHPPNLKRTPYDLCLFFQEAPTSQQVCADVIFPVCSPDLAGDLKSPKDLERIPCLSDTTWVDDWQHWLDATVPGQKITPRGPVYSLYALAVEEALNGAGVLMGHEALLAPLLASGRLIAPFEARVTLPRGLCLWSMPGRSQNSASRHVADWLRGQGEAPS